MGKVKYYDVKERILRIISDQQLYYIEDIPTAETRGEAITMDFLQKNGLDNDEDILAALAINRRRATTFLIKKWIDSDKPQLQLAAFKILCDDDKTLTKISNGTKGDDGNQTPPAINIQIIDNKTVTENAEAVDITEQVAKKKRLKR